MQKSKIILIGGGGHCKSCIDVIEHSGLYEIIGILDQPGRIGEWVLKYQIIGADTDIEKYIALGYQFLITVGQIKNSTVRKRIYTQLEVANAQMATVISPTALVSPYATIGIGTIVMHEAFVNAAALIGENCILNTGSLIEHDSIIGKHSHISTMAVINGDVHIGEEVFIGSNATVSNLVSVTDQTVIGAGSLVNKDIIHPGVYVGNPLRKLQK